MPINRRVRSAGQDGAMHVSAPAVESLPWHLRLLFWRQRRRYGEPLVPALVWSRVPALHAALTGFYAAIERRGSPLPPSLRSMIQIRVSQINDCEFCIDLNAALAAERTGSIDKVLAVERWRDSDRFTASERAALEYAEVMTTTGAAVGPLLIECLRAEFSEEALIELTALIAFQNLSSKFNAALDIPSQGLCRLPTHTSAVTAKSQSV